MLIGGKEDCWITKELKPLKIQTKGKQPAALKKHTQHSWGLLLLIAAKSANIDMLNRLASLITGRVNMATAADPRGYPAGRRIACLFHILTPASVGLALRTKDTAIPQRSSLYFSLHSNLKKKRVVIFLHDSVQLKVFLSCRCPARRKRKLWQGPGSVSHSNSLSHTRSGCRCTALMVLNISMLVGADRACRCAVCK